MLRIAYCSTTLARWRHQDQHLKTASKNLVDKLGGPGEDPGRRHVLRDSFRERQSRQLVDLGLTNNLRRSNNCRFHYLSESIN
ncbi:hypothetical protein IVB41_25485 [Bradyrhizobium sp. 44]|uniref:hypothetical protein n=1 Tax=unclassified Bradyrhizobium TaxID=2631580 RepID=UPI0012DFE723|nr:MULTISPECIES: hypothetical protein [unclassified Bradyrhizobium]MCK1287263.1 hypothetical protein [Bradyrhizobium sp. 44]